MAKNPAIKLPYTLLFSAGNFISHTSIYFLTLSLESLSSLRVYGFCYLKTSYRILVEQC